MLVLSRKVGESIIVGREIKVTFVSFKNGVIRLGIAAPPDISVDREEIHLKKQEGEEPEYLQYG